jgi:hypothetical protein
MSYVVCRYGSWGLIEYTGQAPASAPKYLAVRGLLDAKQPAGVYPGCLGPQKGAAGLGDSAFFGAPAITFPCKASVLIQVCVYVREKKAGKEGPSGRGRGQAAA